jgi:putative pyruvate formate lyase activating enzyme
LGCSFCQNYQISQGLEQGVGDKETSLGKAVSAEDFADICVALCDMGAENINIVTGSHAIPAIVEGIKAARKKGMPLPFLWNSSGYETCESLELLREHIDIYLPDLKTLDSDIAAKFFNAPDYPKTATAAILKMLDMTAERYAKNACEKVIIRHLILPGYLEATRAVLHWFADNAKDRALLSLMTQYTPIPNRKRPMPDRYLSKEEYKTVLEWLEEFKIDEGFCQELVTGSDWLPDFKRQNPFSSQLSVPVAGQFTSQI